MPSKCFLVCVLAAISCLSFAQEGGVLVEGKGWAFLAEAPTGWVRDGRSLASQGIEALYCKEGTRFSPSSLHLYVCPSPKDMDGPENLVDFIEEDEASFMAAYPGILVKDLAPYDTGMGYSFPLRELDDTLDGYYQALAYYEGEGAYFVFVLACRSPEEREAERPALVELLSSFTYLDKE